MRDIEIPTERTIIRPFAPEDAGEVFACISPEITQFTAWEPPPTEEAFAEVWENWLPAMDEGSELTLVPRGRDDGRCLGILGVHALQSGTPELGIWLRRDVHRRRFGHELIGAVARWVSRMHPVRYFEYPVAEENLASRRIAEAYGGEMREHRQNNKYDCVVYHIPPILP
ncbi:GNAT family N-acetyltransferase [Rhizobium sp. 768_B6_N1_8]|uniref:GNAT family N-acetyltransferase n=1 Tax=unclassified Rhizobium TaxID=2613769 RepID=UPI003F222495